MSEKRFELDVRMDMPKLLIDTATNERYNLILVNDIVDIVDLLNEQQELIEELRLQEKEKGVPVFVVRDGKNPVALFFNEQRASWYCQENMAHLTYQQEKWCRVE